jgi:hypothetical protein
MTTNRANQEYDHENSFDPDHRTGRTTKRVTTPPPSLYLPYESRNCLLRPPCTRQASKTPSKSAHHSPCTPGVNRKSSTIQSAPREHLQNSIKSPFPPRLLKRKWLLKRGKPTPGPQRKPASLPTGSCHVHPHPLQGPRSLKEQPRPQRAEQCLQKVKQRLQRVKQWRQGQKQRPRTPEGLEQETGDVGLCFFGMGCISHAICLCYYASFKMSMIIRKTGRNSSMIIEEDWFKKFANLIQQSMGAIQRASQRAI